MLRRGFRSDGPLFVMIGAAGPGLSRLGLTASRRLGGAVRRNRARRLLRECFRRNKPVRALDVVLVAKREILDADYDDLEREYRRRLGDLERRLARARRPGAAAVD